MKTFICLLVSAILGGSSCYSQTIPFGFNSSFTNTKSFTIDNKSDTVGSANTKFKGIDFAALADKIKEQVSTRELAANTAYRNVVEFKTTPTNVTEMNEYRFKVAEARKVLDAELKEIESLKRQELEFRFQDKTSGKFTFLKVSNSVDAEIYYNGILSDSKAKFLSNSLLSFATDGGKASIFNELYADYFGPLRFGFGALISNKQNSEASETPQDIQEKKEDAVQRLLGGGGNGVINISYPIMGYNGGRFQFKLVAAPKLGLDIPGIGTEKNDVSVNYNVGIEGTVFYTGALDIITFFGNFRLGETGGNHIFYNNLIKENRNSFAFHQVSAGVAISSMFRVSYNYYFGSDFVRTNFPKSFSFTIIPK